jgi:hypothetical protein
MTSKAALLPLDTSIKSDPGRRVMILAATLASVATTAVLLRLNARRRSRVAFGLDDLFICCALVWIAGLP